MTPSTTPPTARSLEPPARRSGRPLCDPGGQPGGSGQRQLHAELRYNNVTFAITPKPITVTADNKTKQLGANDPPLTYSVPSGSLAFNDTPATVFNGSLTRDPGENVGVSYTIRKGTLSTNSNYTIGTFNNGTLKIVYGGGFLGIQQPINGGMGESIALTANSVGTGHDTDFDDDTSRFKLGSTVPVKFELRDASGAPVTAADVVSLTVKVADNKPDPGVTSRSRRWLPPRATRSASRTQPPASTCSTSDQEPLHEPQYRGRRQLHLAGHLHALGLAERWHQPVCQHPAREVS